MTQRKGIGEDKIPGFCVSAWDPVGFGQQQQQQGQCTNE
jgi:hypothetical protein